MNNPSGSNPASSITASLKYLADVDAAAVYRVGESNQKDTEHLAKFAVQQCQVHDAREMDREFSLDREGFCLVQQPSKVTDFYRDAELEDVYEAEVKAAVMQATGADRIEIFDHTRRSSSNDVRSRRDVREPASVIHNDYSADSGINRLRDHFAGTDEDVEALLQKRFAIVNVWRSINGPVLRSPLALCDALTTSSTDLVPVRRESKERVGELQQALHNPAHQWYYYPEMQMDEALLIKTFDSSLRGHTRFTLHTAIDLPGCNEQTPARESLETRCFVFFHNELPGKVEAPANPGYPRLRRVSDNSTFPIEGTMSVGRASSCDIVLKTELGASRKHARLVRDDKKVTIEDLESNNGTLINRKLVRGEVILQHLDEVIFDRELYCYESIPVKSDNLNPRNRKLRPRPKPRSKTRWNPGNLVGGDTVFLSDFAKQEVDVDTPQDEAIEPFDPSAPCLQYLDGPRKGQIVLLEGEGTSWKLGSSEDQDIVLSAEGISQTHATLSIEDDQWRLSDAVSQNGTFVNGERCNSRFISSGDIISLGPMALRFGCPDSVPVNIPATTGISPKVKLASVLLLLGCVVAGIIWKLF